MENQQVCGNYVTNSYITNRLKKKNHMGNYKICWDENKNIIHQNLWDEVKAVFKGKFITIYAHIF